jgi:hypothetical protein
MAQTIQQKAGLGTSSTRSQIVSVAVMIRP